MTTTEVLDERLSKSAALTIERSAQRHWRTVRRSTLLLCAELRQLQDGEAHLLRGYASFAQYAAERIAPELSEANVKKLSWRGSPLLALARHGRLKLDDRTALPIGTTGAQALASVLTQWGEQKMLEVYDLALTLKPGSPLSDVTVARARRELEPPRPKPPLESSTYEPDTAFVEPTDPEREPYDAAQLPADLQATRETLDDLIDDLIHTEVGESDRQAGLREIAAIRTRIDRLAEALRRTTD
jgi:hypothetical protein